MIDIKATKDELFYNTVLEKAKIVILDTKKYSKQGIRSFLHDRFKEYMSNKEKDTLLNVMSLYNGRNKFIKLFESKDITPSMYASDAKSDEVEKSEQKFDERIGERLKLRRQKADYKTDEQSETTDMPDLESEESAAQRRNQRRQGLKMLTPQRLDYQTKT